MTQDVALRKIVPANVEVDGSPIDVKAMMQAIALDIGKQLVAYIEVMYPKAIEATSSTFKLSMRNHIYNDVEGGTSMQPNWIETRAARSLLRRHVPIDSIALHFANRYTPEEINGAVMALRERERINRKVVLRPDNWNALSPDRGKVSVPLAVIDDRDRRLALVPLSVTAARMGDPLPGCSALERQRTDAPSVIPDPLAYLMFPRRKTGARFG